MVAIAITRMDLTAAALRSASAKSRDAQAARRMLALALVLEGADRKTAAQTCGMDRQTLRDWVHRYNAEGLAGLSNHRGASRPRRLAPGQMSELVAWLEAGPDPAVDGGGALAATGPATADHCPFRGGVARADGGQVPGWARLPAALGAPPPPEDRAGGAGSLQKNFAEAVAAAVPEAASDKPLEVWFQDEARVGQQGTLTRVWAKRGTRPRAPRDTRYQWAYIFGAVCPQRGVAAGLVMPFADTGAMNDHLAEISRTVAPGAHAVLILDGAGWHGGHALVVPDNVSLVTLPPYSPELNPVENVWQYLRANWLAISVFDDYGAIVEACCKAWNHFADHPDVVSSITSRQWAEVKP